MPPFQIEILLLNSNIPNGDKAPEIFPHVRMFPNSLYVAQFFFSQNPNYLPLTTTASGPHIPQCFLACCSIWKFCSAVHLLIRLSLLDICPCQFQHHRHRCCNYFQQCGSFFRKFKNMTLNGIIISKLSKCKVRPHKIDICTPRKVYWPVAVDRGWGEMLNIGFPKKNSSVSASHLSSHTQKAKPLFQLGQTLPGSRYRRIFSEGLLKITEQGKLSAAKLRSTFTSGESERIQNICQVVADLLLPNSDWSLGSASSSLSTSPAWPPPARSSPPPPPWRSPPRPPTSACWGSSATGQAR